MRILNLPDDSTVTITPRYDIEGVPWDVVMVKRLRYSENYADEPSETDIAAFIEKAKEAMP